MLYKYPFPIPIAPFIESMSPQATHAAHQPLFRHSGLDPESLLNEYSLPSFECEQARRRLRHKTKIVAAGDT